MADKKQLLEGLKDLVWQTYELEEVVKNFSGGAGLPGRAAQPSQAVLEAKLCKFTEDLCNLAALHTSMQGVMIPADLLQYVDEGGNPHQYTAEAFRACTRDNQLSKGKVCAVRELQQALTAELPADVATEYRRLTIGRG